jgi:nucleoside-diphosphate-sugar epimerase
MKVFLTGGTGVVGTRALPALVADGHSVVAVARGPEKADLVRRLGGTPVEVDLFDASAVKAAVDGSEAVVNLATAIPPLAKSARASSWTLNDRLRTEASTHLVDAALATGAARFVQESICFPYVDGGADWIDEDSPTDHGPGPFHAALAAEANAARFSEGGGVGVVLRFAQFVAPEATHTQSMNGMLRKRISPFPGDPDGYVSSIHAEDAGSAVAAAFRAPAGIFNIVDDEPLVRREAGEVCAAALGVKPPHSLPRAALKIAPPSARAIMRSLRVSHARFTEATGWTPTHTSLRTYWPTDSASSSGAGA